MNDDRHLKTEDLTAYLEGTLPADRAVTAETHLADCDECRADFVAARRALLPDTSRKSYWIAGTALAAAVLLGIPILWPTFGPAGRIDVERGNSAPTLEPVMIVEPADGGLVPGGGVRFVWRSVAEAGQYRLTLTDSTGARIWSADRSDTTVALETPGLAKGAAYYWLVDALLPDGRIRSSTTHRFSTAP